MYPTPLTLSEPDEVAAKLRDLWRRRCRFTAFVGAGLSIASGIPATGHFMSSYLAFCMEEWFSRQWNPKDGNWPSLSNGNIKSIREYEREWLKEVNTKKPNSHTKQKRALRLGMLGAIQYWQDALVFLARAGRLNAEPILGPPDSSVHDSFFQFIVKGGEPSLGHRMLATLSDQLRINLILTTNFDSLTETAFNTYGTRLNSFDVHHDAALPSPRLVLGRPSIVKLHGGQYGLRADWSLDHPPSESDKFAFLSYLAGEEIAPDSNSNNSGTQNRDTDTVGLLVVGYSAGDERIRGLICEAMKTLKHLHIFWFCHTLGDCKIVAGTNNDLERKEAVRSLFGDIIRHSKLDRDAIAKRLHVFHGDFGLLALEAYQNLTGTLPPTGMFFPTSWNLPYPPMIPPPPHDSIQMRSFQNAKANVGIALRSSIVRGIPLIEVTNTDGQYGSLATCATIFRDGFGEDTDQIKPPVDSSSIEHAWMDLDDVLEPNDIFFHMLGIMEKKAGVVDPRPHPPKIRSARQRQSNINAFAEWFSAEIRALGLTGKRKWIFFLNGRDQPGSNHFVRGGTRSSAWNNPYRFIRQWIDILHLLRKGEITIHIVLVTTEDIEPWSILKRRRRNWDVVKLPHVVQFETDQVAKDIAEWCKRKSANAILVYTMLEFDFVRYPSAIRRVMELCMDRQLFTREELMLDDSHGVPFDEWISSSLRVLAKKKLFRTKAGGFIWMNVTLRERLKMTFKQPKASDCIRIQRLIARWYGRLFISSADPRAALAVASHALNGTEIWLHSEARDKVDDSSQIVTLLRHARIVLMTAESQLKLRVAEEQTGTSLSLLFARGCKLEREVIISVNRIKLVKKNDSLLVLGEIKLIINTIASVALSVWQIERNGPQIDVLTRQLQVRMSGNMPSMAEIMPCIEAAQDSHRSGGSALSFSVSLDAGLQQAFVALTRRDYCSSLKSMRELLEAGVGAEGVQLFELRPHIDEDRWQIPRIIGALESRQDNSVHHVRQWLVSAQPDVKRIEFCIRLFRRMCYLCMHIGQATYLAEHRSNRGNIGPKRAQQEYYLREALKWCECGLEMLRGYPGNDDSFVYHQHARFRAHLGLIQARMASWEEDQDRAMELFQRAKSTLLDAEAFAIEFPLVEDSLSRAIILLRRAELKLLRIRSWCHFREIHRHLICGLEPKIDDALVSDDVFDKMRLIHDTWDCLDKADSHLVPHLKNEWWPQLSFVLKVQAIECNWVCLWLMAGKEKAGGKFEEPNWSVGITAKMKGFLDEGIGRFPTAYSAEDIFFVARITEAVCNLKDLGFNVNEKQFKVLCAALTRNRTRKVFPSIAKYVAVVRMRIK